MIIKDRRSSSKPVCAICLKIIEEEPITLHKEECAVCGMPICLKCQDLIAENIPQTLRLPTKAVCPEHSRMVKTPCPKVDILGHICMGCPQRNHLIKCPYKQEQ